MFRNKFFIVFFVGRPRNCARVVGRLSGYPETVTTLSVDFRDAPKLCPRCRGIFGMPRNRVGVVGRFSGYPENLPAQH